MVRIAVVLSVAALALAACGAGDTNGAGDVEPEATAAAGDEQLPGDPAPTEAPSDPVVDVSAPDPCALFVDVDIASLISTQAGDFSVGDDECSVAAVDPLEFAQASITVGDAPAMPVIRSNFDGTLYECEVVDVEGLGDEAFSCLGGTAASHVVFALGPYLIVFSAGNNVAGPPPDMLMMEAADQILANMSR